MLNSECPLPTTLEDLLEATCLEQFGQIQKLAIRMINPANRGVWVAESEILDKSTWEDFKAASDSTKIVITPNIPGIVIPNSETLMEEGGNNNTIDGIAILVGKGIVKVTGKCLNMPVAVAKSLEALTKFSNVSGATLIEAFFFNEAGQIIHQVNDEDQRIGFPIYNFVISSVGTEGYNKSNTHMVSFEMKGNWDDKLAIVSPLKLGSPTPWDPRKL